jgi:hypothetical protein
MDDPGEQPEVEYPPTVVDQARAKAARKAAQQRAQWERQGRTTRAQYNRLPGAIPADLQEDIVRKYKGGSKRKEIQDSYRGRVPGVTEYAIKFVLRVYRNDPDAFGDGPEDIVVIRK